MPSTRTRRGNMTWAQRIADAQRKGKLSKLSPGEIKYRLRKRTA